jgi:hypothetical protein
MAQTLRLIVFVFFTICFLGSLVFIIPNINELPPTLKITVTIPLLLSLGVVLVSYWVYEDGKRIDSLFVGSGVDEEIVQSKINRLNDALTEDDIEKITIVDILRGVDDAKYELMAKTLHNRYKSKGFLHPTLILEENIKRKMSEGKTKETAIEELYNQKDAS